MDKLTYTIDIPARIVRLDYQASPDWPEMQEVLERLLADPSHRPGMGILADRSHVDTPQTVGYIRQIMAYVRKHQSQFGDARWGLVVRGAGPEGMGKLAQVLGDGIPTMELELFDNTADAEAWLRSKPA
ncbi:MAG TPA: hypothetical protein VF720_06995 [Candidatus Eisenbacteria bacterium]